MEGQVANMSISGHFFNVKQEIVQAYLMLRAFFTEDRSEQVKCFQLFMDILSDKYHPLIILCTLARPLGPVLSSQAADCEVN